MTRRFNLKHESASFGDELSEVLNGTVCNGVRLTSVVSSRHSTDRTVVGYLISKRNQHTIQGVPVTTGRREPSFYLGLSVHLAPDEAQKYLMVTQSVMILAVDAEVSNDENVLLHYDYEREKADNYPEAHLQICATSPAWERAGQRLDGRERLLERLHLPVGGRRFRPTLEDLIEFLVREKLADSHTGWDTVLENSRSGFQEKQLRAAVRRNPEAAVEVLREQGYEITSPAT